MAEAKRMRERGVRFKTITRRRGETVAEEEGEEAEEKEGS